MRYLACYLFAALALAVPASGETIKYHPMPHGWHAPKAWLVGATCIHNHEGAWNDNTGNTYFGGMQFLRSTWEHAGGPYEKAFDHPGDQAHYPFTSAPREQLYYSYVVWLRDGRSWREWGTRGACGLS